MKQPCRSRRGEVGEIEVGSSEFAVEFLLDRHSRAKVMRDCVSYNPCRNYGFLDVAPFSFSPSFLFNNYFFNFRTFCSVTSIS